MNYMLIIVIIDHSLLVRFMKILFSTYQLGQKAKVNRYNLARGSRVHDRFYFNNFFLILFYFIFLFLFLCAYHEDASC